MHLKYNDAAINDAGDGVLTAADRIRSAGTDLYNHLNNLIASGQLSGEGIAEAMQQSHQRWNQACDEFAVAETKFGTLVKEATTNMMVADRRGGNIILG